MFDMKTTNPHQTFAESKGKDSMTSLKNTHNTDKILCFYGFNPCVSKWSVMGPNII